MTLLRQNVCSGPQDLHVTGHPEITSYHWPFALLEVGCIRINYLHKAACNSVFLFETFAFVRILNRDSSSDWFKLSINIFYIN